MTGGSAAAAGLRATECYVANGATSTIIELGTCKELTNNSGQEVFALATGAGNGGAGAVDQVTLTWN